MVHMLKICNKRFVLEIFVIYLQMSNISRPNFYIKTGPHNTLRLQIFTAISGVHLHLIHPRTFHPMGILFSVKVHPFLASHLCDVFVTVKIKHSFKII